MPVRFTCPYCGWTTKVADRYVGRSGDCASCGKPIEVPADDDAHPRLQKTARTHLPLLMAGVLAVVLVVGVVFFAGMAYVVLKPTSIPLLNRAPDAAKCAANLSKVGSAIAAYANDKGHFPPAYTVNEAGLPLHSWRVLILPYMGYEALYEQLALDEPWDSQHNSRFVKQMPIEYRCPADTQALDAETNYFVVQGPGGYVFDASRTSTRKDITDGAAQTLLVIEASGMAVVWMQPTDIASPELAWAGGAGYRGIGSQHVDGRFFILTADGKVSALDANTSMMELQALATMSGNESVYPALAPP